MLKEDFSLLYPYLYESELRWGEMDAMQHLNNVYYFRYFESGRMAFWEALKQQTSNLVAPSIGPILASTNCRYKQPLYFPDNIIVGTRIKSVGRDRFLIEHALFSEKNQAVAAEGEALIVSFDYEQKKKVSLPTSWHEFLTQK